MTTFRDKVAPSFSLDRLSLKDPHSHDDMAALLLETYVINAQAIAIGQAQAVDAYATRRPGKLLYAEALLRDMARKNLFTVAGFLGPRLIIATARQDVIREPIRAGGLTSVPEATGVPRLDIHGTRLQLAPRKQLDTLRLFQTLPDNDRLDATPWWNVQVVGPAFVPLVDLQVSPPDTNNLQALVQRFRR